MITRKKRQTGKSCAVAHFASVDVTADVEPHDPNGGDTTEHNSQDLNEHEESSHDADSNPCFVEIPEDSPEDELEPSVGYTTRATGQSGRLVSSKRNRVVDPQAEPDLLKDDCQAP